MDAQDTLDDVKSVRAEASALSANERVATPLLVGLSLVHMLVVAAMLPRIDVPVKLGLIDIDVLIKIALGIQAVFVIEFFVKLVTNRHDDRGLAFLTMLLPPLRMAVRPLADPDVIWLPASGWIAVTRERRLQLEHAFAKPMIAVALLILPILVVEFFFKEMLDQLVWLYWSVDIGMRLIWLAFAVEFVVLLSVSRRKLRFCREHWVDLAIIVLPVISFLRAFRLLRLGRMAQLNKMARLQRARGLATKLRQTLVILGLAGKKNIRSTKRQLEDLEEDLEEQLEQVEDLRDRIAQIRQELEQQRAEAADD